MWYKENKAAEKYSPSKVKEILALTYEHLQDNPEVFLKVDVALYMLQTHGVSERTRRHWISKLYKDDNSIADLWDAIEKTIESRLVKMEKGIRPAIQAMVLQNRHDYREKHEQKIDGGATIIINRPEKKSEAEEKDTES